MESKYPKSNRYKPKPERKSIDELEYFKGKDMSEDFDLFLQSEGIDFNTFRREQIIGNLIKVGYIKVMPFTASIVPGYIDCCSLEHNEERLSGNESTFHDIAQQDNEKVDNSMVMEKYTDNGKIIIECDVVQNEKPIIKLNECPNVSEGTDTKIETTYPEQASNMENDKSRMSRSFIRRLLHSKGGKTH